MHRLTPLAVLVLLTILPAGATAHTPSVVESRTSGPDAAVVLDDPTLSRAIGATLDAPGEVDWYRLDLQAGDPLVVGLTAPDTRGAVAATFTLLGPGLPDADAMGPEAQALAAVTGVGGAVMFEPLDDPPREVHGGLGFINFGELRLEAPEDGSYYVAVRAVDPQATGKYVLAPGVREEFGLDAIGGMLDMIGFFDAPWPPEPRT
jgi:hypothetical protein